MKTKVEEHYDIFTNGNKYIHSLTPRAIMEFAESYHNEQLKLCEVSRSLPTSTQLLSDCKNRFKDLRANNYVFDYRSYKNGYLDSFSKYAIKPSDNYG